MNIIQHDTLFDLLYTMFAKCIDGLTKEKFVDIDFTAVLNTGEEVTVTLHELMQPKKALRCDAWTDGNDLHVWRGKGCRRVKLLEVVAHEWAHMNLQKHKDRIKEEAKAVEHEEKIVELFKKGIITKEVNDCLSIVDRILCAR